MTRDGERKAQVFTCPHCGKQTPVRVMDPFCFAHKTRHPNGETHGRDVVTDVVAAVRTSDAAIVAAIRAIRPLR